MTTIVKCKRSEKEMKEMDEDPVMMTIRRISNSSKKRRRRRRWKGLGRNMVVVITRR